MSIEWIFGLVIAGQAGLLGILLKHIIDCNTRDRSRNDRDEKITRQLTVIDTTTTSIVRELGDRETGIRGQLHAHTKEIILLNAKVFGK